MTPAISFEEIDQAVEQVSPTMERLARELWEISELSLEEVQSARLLMACLQEAGFTITSRGTARVPTAFIAEWGGDRPFLGILAEYDALPGLGNEPVPHKKPRKDQVTSGHGCGHNLLGSAAIGTAIALKHLMEERRLPGALRVYGCAAEETEGAKVYMAREGLFNDLDAVLHWHPGGEAAVSNIRSAATNSVRIEFFGKAAHAGGTPWLGRSAVHTAELCAHGINLMREHVEPTARIHYIFEQGGEAPNVVPDYARIKLYVRDIDRAHVEASTHWIKQIVEGAALATQTRGVALVYSGLYDLLPNRPLAERMQVHLERIGIPAFTEEEQAFARELQQSFGVEPNGMATATTPLPEDEPAFGFSTDVGDVSWCTPTMGCGMPTVPLEVGLHTWAATACHGTSIGLKGAISAARVLVSTGVDILTDSALRQAARVDFDRRTQSKPYISPLGPEMERPLEIPEWVLQTMSDSSS